MPTVLSNVKITFKLFATLADYLPADAVRNEVSLVVPDTCCVGTVIDQHHLPERLVHLVLVNGHFVETSARSTHRLQEGDVLAIWPPIAGG